MTVERVWHWRKQSSLIDSTPDFTITSHKPVQQLKQLGPTVVTVDGIQIELNEAQH
jgi:hypothetical protein